MQFYVTLFSVSQFPLFLHRDGGVSECGPSPPPEALFRRESDAVAAARRVKSLTPAVYSEAGRLIHGPTGL